MATPLEEYMQELLSQHKLQESITDTDYENDIVQSQAAEAQALAEADSAPFRVAARSYNMDPDEWVGQEAEGRERIKRAVSANYANQRAKTVNNRAQGKKEFTQNLLGTLSRLNSVNQRSISSIEEFAPRDAGLRSHLVFDPETGSVTQQTKNLPDEDAVRSKEIADYLQVPEQVVARQRVQERQAVNDLNWKQMKRQLFVEKEIKAEARAQTADEQAAVKGRWASVMRQASAAIKFSNQPKAFVDQILADPDAMPEMKASAAMGNAIREGTAGAAQEKDRRKWMRIADAIARKSLETNVDYQTSIADGKPMNEIYTQALHGAFEVMKEKDRQGVSSSSLYNSDEYMDDFGFQTDSTLSQIEEHSRERQELDRLLGVR